jgi:hypothetical protein
VFWADCRYLRFILEGMSSVGGSPYACRTYRDNHIIEEATFQGLGEAIEACSRRANDEAEAQQPSCWVRGDSHSRRAESTSLRAGKQYC